MEKRILHQLGCPKSSKKTVIKKKTRKIGQPKWCRTFVHQPYDASTTFQCFFFFFLAACWATNWGYIQTCRPGFFCGMDWMRMGSFSDVHHSERIWRSLENLLCLKKCLKKIRCTEVNSGSGIVFHIFSPLRYFNLHGLAFSTHVDVSPCYQPQTNEKNPKVWSLKGQVEESWIFDF